MSIWLPKDTTMFTERTPPNGLRALAIGSPGTSTVASKLFLKAGSRHDGDRHGIGHCLEHALFWGTTTRGSRELYSAIEDRGGRIQGEEAILSLAGIVGLETLLTGQFEPFAEAGRRVYNVTPQDVLRVAVRYLDTERYALVMVGPLDGGSSS